MSISSGQVGILIAMRLCGFQRNSTSKPCKKPVGQAGWCGTKGHPRWPRTSSDAAVSAAAQDTLSASDETRLFELRLGNPTPHSCHVRIADDGNEHYFWSAQHLGNSSDEARLEGAASDVVGAFTEAWSAARELEQRFGVLQQNEASQFDGDMPRRSTPADDGDGKNSIHAVTAHLAEQGRSF